VKATRERLFLAWTAIPVALPLLLCAAVWHLGALRSRVDLLEREIVAKRGTLAALAVPEEERAALDGRRARLAEWSAFLESDSERIAELSRVAWRTGVGLRSLRNHAPERSADGQVLSCAHELSAIGTYRQLADFLDGISRARGMAAIDELEIRHDGPAGTNLLAASLGVKWFAEAPPAEPEEEPTP
jgi:hypothetical protein